LSIGVKIVNFVIPEPICIWVCFYFAVRKIIGSSLTMDFLNSKSERPLKDQKGIPGG
jgi:hypothetical protein